MSQSNTFTPAAKKDLDLAMRELTDQVELLRQVLDDIGEDLS